MALFPKPKESFEVIREGEDTILRIEYDDTAGIPSLEDSPTCMASTMDRLIEVGNVTKIVFHQKRDYEYDYDQTILLLEIAKLFNQIAKQKNLFGFETIVNDEPYQKHFHEIYSEVQRLLFHLFKSDPLGAYVEIKRLIRKEHIRIQKEMSEKTIAYINTIIKGLMDILEMLDLTQLIQIAKPSLAGYQLGDRSVYRKIFSPTIKPDFMFTKLMSSYPPDAEELDNYTIGENIDVSIFKLNDTIQYLYHVYPPEFKLSEEKYEILDLARKIMSEHKPQRDEFVDPARMRQVFYNVGHDLIEELANYRNVKLTQKDIDELTKILVRYTVGFGLVEVLLQDEHVQDLSINAPMGRTPIFLVHSEYGDCNTNIIPTKTEADSWASKLRLISGRPLDEANPILDTEVEIPGASSRVSVISEPLNPFGLGFSFRRHRDKPWTLPLFMKARMINAEAAGILSFIIDGSRTLLVAGTRGSGKTSLLGALLIEIMRRYRILTIEDTLELPTSALRKMGYNIQAMKVASALRASSSEVPADEGIRTTLRLGDSCLIVGEVRSTEASALYEAMRVGALANVVAGTIHGDSPYGVFDRVVNDLKVPRTSFKATDVNIVANPIRSADGLHSWRRVFSITEIRKQWEDDPLLENGFVDLMKYNSTTDQLEPSDDLINGDSDILKSIAGKVKDWVGNWDAVWENIQLRADCKQLIVDTAAKLKNDDLLEAPFVIQANDEFHKATDRVKEEFGSLDTKRIFAEYTDWVKKASVEWGKKQQPKR